jgi:SAM-dependent MidA family methyltransferase
MPFSLTTGMRAHFPQSQGRGIFAHDRTRDNPSEPGERGQEAGERCANHAAPGGSRSGAGAGDLGEIEGRAGSVFITVGIGFARPAPKGSGTLPAMPAHVRDEFESITESAPLVAELRARIERDGPISFRDFMAAALYHPQHGYYHTQAAATSRGGDYVTGPEVHPIFGALVGRQLSELWEVMDRPAAFDIVEQGGGRGLLARDVLRWAAGAAPAFLEAIHYTLVEPNAMLRREQEASLADAETGAQVSWTEDLPLAIEGCVLTNELLDAFPVHRVVREGGVLREVYVAHDGARFFDQPGPLSHAAIAAYFDDLKLLPGVGCYAEVNLASPVWMARVASRLKRGYVLTFDYGYEAADLYAPWRRDGTLLCFYRQTASSDPYQRIGRQDMTASVDFTTLRRAGERAGLTTAAMTDQSQFLLRMGVGQGIASVAEGSQLEEYFARRNVVLDLIDPAKLGRVKVLLQSKDAVGGPFTGFIDA